MEYNPLKLIVWLILLAITVVFLVDYLVKVPPTPPSTQYHTSGQETNSIPTVSDIGTKG
jgi:hypothetical protein